MKKLLLTLFLGGVLAVPALAQTFNYTYQGQEIEYTVQENEPTTVYVTGFFPDMNAEPDIDLGFAPVDLIVPDVVTHEESTFKVTGIGYGAFRGGEGATRLVSVKLPDDITVIEDNAFFRCINMESISLPASLESIGVNAFADCQSLNSISIPSPVKFIGENAFSGCTGLQKVEYASMKDLLNIEFESGDILTGGDSNPLIYAHKLFIGGEYISEIIIPDNVTGIGAYTFAGGDFVKVELSNSLKSIGQHAFEGCSNLTSLTIPNSVETIGYSAFKDCKIRNLVLEEGPVDIDGIDTAFETRYIHDLYIGRPHSNQLLNTVGLSTSLSNLTIGNCVKEVLDDEFCGLANLTKLTLGSNIETIGIGAFFACPKLKQVILPPGVQTVKSKAFSNTSVSDVVIAYGIRDIASDAFAGSPVETVAITAQNVPEVGANAFSNHDFKLLVEGETAKQKYSVSDFWSGLDCELLIEPSTLRYTGASYIQGEEYDVIHLSGKVRPEEVSLPYIFWNTTDPSVATVTTDGVVTLQPGITDINETSEYFITAETAYVNTQPVKVRIFNGDIPGGVEENGIEEAAPVAIDYSAPYAVYGLDGRLAGDSTEGLAKGIYIIRQGDVTGKVIVR